MVLFIAVFVILALLLAKQFQQTTAVNPQTPQTQSPIMQGPFTHPQEGVIEINAYEWRGISCTEPNMQVVAEIVTKNVWWQLRLDHDDGRIYDSHPRDMPGEKNVRFNDPAHVFEWRIKPGQSITTGSIRFNIEPDTNNASKASQN